MPSDLDAVLKDNFDGLFRKDREEFQDQFVGVRRFASWTSKELKLTFREYETKKCMSILIARAIIASYKWAVSPPSKGLYTNYY